MRLIFRVVPKISTLLQSLDARFPFARAESWDKTGLQIGDASAEIESVLVAYEITDALLDEARDGDCIVTYHPLLFRPLENLDFKNHTARLAARVLRQSQSVISVHTALDGAAPPHALGDALAQSLRLQNVRVLSPSGQQKLVKIGVMVPETHLEIVREAVWSAGAGRIGQFYDQASFHFSGQGTFRALEGATPALGNVGEREETAEIRLEVVADEAKFPAILVAMKAAHPYQEMAYDVTALLNQGENQGFGPARLGEIAPCSLDDFARQVQNALGPPNLRIVRAKNEIQKVVCSPGAGASFIAGAARAGADVLVCGDIKHHDALQARALGISLLDVTHAATERATIPLMSAVLEVISGLEVRRGAMNNPLESLA